jgi:PAS domain S-box-containing protein
LSALIPIALVLVGGAIVALFAYERVARDVVEQRDTELARTSALRLSESLSRVGEILTGFAMEDDVKSLEPIRLGPVLERFQSQYYLLFDAGVAIYSREGVALWTQPRTLERQRADILVPSEFNQVRKTLRPAFSNVFEDAASGQDVVLVGVPITGSDGEFRGMMGGMLNIRTSSVGARLSEILELKAGRTGYAYLVDGSGRVIYHRDYPLLGKSLSTTDPVMRAMQQETGAILGDDSKGERVISGFARVPGTSWSLITQERWDNVVGPIRGYNWLLVGLMVTGGVLCVGAVFLALGRLLNPIKDLTQGAKRIAGGDFDYTITAKSNDEIQALAQQFNAMAGTLKESYASLEQQVADRTRDLGESEARLRSTITGAPIVLFALDREAVFTFSQGKGLEPLGLGPDEIVGQSAHDVYREVPEILGNIGRALAGEEFTSVVDVGGWAFETRYSPLRNENGDIDGVIGVSTDITERRKAEEELRTAHQRLVDIVDFLPDATFVIDHEKKVIAWNRAIEETTGVRKEEIIGQGDFAYAVPFYGKRRPVLIDLLGTEKTETESEYDYVEERGNTLLAEVFLPSLRGGVGAHVLATASLLLDAEGKQYGAIESIRDITDRKRAEEEYSQQNREMAVLEERNRMAREIHDTLAQGFTGIVLQLEAGEEALESDPVQAHWHLDRARALARDSLQSARRSVWNLLPETLEQHSLETAMQKEVDSFARDQEGEVTFSICGERRECPSDVQTALFRICQESLANVRRHAEAKKVDVVLDFLPEVVCLRVKDDGVGFDAAAKRTPVRGGSFGLTGMEQRARLVGGRLSVKSQEGQGTLIEVSMPVRRDSHG